MFRENFRLDWQSEAAELEPYFKGQPGVVRINFRSEDAAVGKFNHFIKKQFQDGVGNGQRLSLRLDEEWITTYTLDDQIHAIAEKLKEAGIVFDRPHGQVATAIGEVASRNVSGGDTIISISNISIENGENVSPRGFQGRREIVFNAMERFVEKGGRFMLIVNDMKRDHQGKIWKSIWDAGLKKAGGDHVSLIYYVGPKCGHEPHDDAPAPDVEFRLPDDIETDKGRREEVYKDILEILDHKGYNKETASAIADTIVSINSHSVKELHMGLSKTIMSIAAKKGSV